MSEVSDKFMKVKQEQIDRLAAAFLRVVGKDPRDVVMFQQTVVGEDHKVMLKTWFECKDNEGVELIGALRKHIEVLEKRLKEHETDFDFAKMVKPDLALVSYLEKGIKSSKRNTSRKLKGGK